VPTVALVGYTNAGKTTLFNALTGDSAVASDALFVTLDPLVRKVRLPDRRELLVSDTVGFIDRLPHTLVAAFRATLEEVAASDLLVHVIDASNPERELQMSAVRSVLAEVGAADVPSIEVFNKLDRLDAGERTRLQALYPGAITMSALTGDGRDELVSALEARLALDTGVDGAFVEGRTPAEIDEALAESESGREWLAELEAVKDPWFHMATGDGLYHYYGSWLDDPTIPYASLTGHIGALRAGEEIDRPTDHVATERDRLASEYGALLDDDARKGFDELLALSRTVFPYVEEHKFLCDYWFLTSWWNTIREFGGLLAEHGFLQDREDVFQLSRLEVYSALDELLLTWATGGQPRGPSYWPPIVAKRKELLERLAEWTPPPAVGAVPEAILDPALIMLWGVTTQRVHAWAQESDDGSELSGTPASPGVVEGVARVVRHVSEIGDVREGEILVCSITSPAWAPIFSKIQAAVTDIGGVMSHAAIVCREYALPAVVGTGRATSQISTGQRIRVDGSAGSVTLLE